jgi:predicted AlkP superfamily pyrophosphatase or phosphodiesterase
MDFLFNFRSQALTEDNLITQMFLSNKKIVFYGDDTWEKLFPEHFVRHEGTTSFFVAVINDLICGNPGNRILWKLIIM